MRVTDTILHWGDTRGMQVGIDIGNESDGYSLTVGGYRLMQVLYLMVFYLSKCFYQLRSLKRTSRKSSRLIIQI